MQTRENYEFVQKKNGTMNSSFLFFINPIQNILYTQFYAYYSETDNDTNQ